MFFNNLRSLKTCQRKLDEKNVDLAIHLVSSYPLKSLHLFTDFFALDLSLKY